MHCLCIVHESHDTIFTFKNYFVIVFLVFNFSKNKFNLNESGTSLPLFPYDHDKTGSVHKGEKNG